MLWIIIRSLWIRYDRDDFDTLFLGIPILAILILFLIQHLKKYRSNIQPTLNETPFVDFIKSFNGVRIDTVADKYTGETKRFFVFTKETRAQFDKTLDSTMTAEDISHIKDELLVVKKGDKYIVSKKS